MHCGFCLPSCPTYTLWGEEMDSPRGRIHLMNLVERGEIELDATVATHFDRCLGCLACVPACPSGVRYDILIQRARAARRERAPRSLRQRAIESGVLAAAERPRLLRALVWPLALGVRPFPLAPRVKPADLRARPPRLVPARGEVRLRAAMLEGCVQRVLFGRVNRAAAAVLAADGCEVVVPEPQGCCGALALHAGHEEDATRLARRTIAALGGHERVVVTAAGCGSAMKEYGDLLGTEEARRFSASVRDATELAGELGAVAERRPRAPVRVAYQDACHLRQAQGVSAEPRALLAAIPGVELVEIDDPDTCCGSAGIYNLLEPATARELGARKARAVLDAAPDMLATANPGCAIQIAAALRRMGHPQLPIVHPLELVADAVADC